MKKLLQFLKKELNPSIFVETGTFRGDTLALALKYFSTCYSGELSPELHEEALARFAGNPHVHLHLGPSPDFLRTLAAELAAQPVVYWLDAHWCSADKTAGVESQTPILEEINAIARLNEDSVILIDDARLYLSTPPAPHSIADWPDIHDLIKALLKLSDHHRVAVFDDVFAFYPERLKFSFQKHIHETASDWLYIANEYRDYQKFKTRRLFRYLT